MDDLVPWLRAQLDEDERVARAAAWRSESWTHRTLADTTGPDHVLVVNERFMVAGFFEDDPVRPTEAAHIARHDPARVLAEVAAKRAIVELHYVIERKVGWLDDGYDGGGYRPVCEACVPKYSSFESEDKVPTGYCQTVRHLAAVYADCPGYRPEWAPNPSG